MARCTEWWELSNGLYGARLKKGVAEQTALTKLAAYEDRAGEPRDVNALVEENEQLRKRCAAAKNMEPLTLTGVKRRQGMPVFCAKSNLYGVVGFRRTPREGFCIGFWYGWEWLDDVWKANEGQIYVSDPLEG